MSLLYHKVYAGTVHGAGLDCRTGDVHSFEGSTDGIWNKVGYAINLYRKLYQYS